MARVKQTYTRNQSQRLQIALTSAMMEAGIRKMHIDNAGYQEAVMAGEIPGIEMIDDEDGSGFTIKIVWESEVKKIIAEKGDTLTIVENGNEHMTKRLLN